MMAEWTQLPPWLPLMGGLVGLLLGFVFFLFSTNRLLSFLSSLVQKSVLMPLLFFASLSLFGWLGWWATSELGWISPILMLGCLGVGGVYTRQIELAYYAGPPEINEGPKPSIWRPVTTHSLQTLSYKVELGKALPFPIRIVQISDLHANQRLGMDYYHQVLDQVRTLQADILVWTGDYVSNSSKLGLLEELLQDLPTRLGSFAVLGNHDYWAGEAGIIRVLEAAGLQMLSWRPARVPLDAATTLVISGCELPWSRNPCQIASPKAEEISIVLSHSADSIFSFSEAGADLVFSGHFHAGQIRLPWIGPLVVPSKFGRRFYHGHFKIDQTHLFVSAGVGASTPYVRLYCPPDIMVVDLHSQKVME